MGTTHNLHASDQNDWPQINGNRNVNLISNSNNKHKQTNKRMDRNTWTIRQLSRDCARKPIAAQPFQ